MKNRFKIIVRATVAIVAAVSALRAPHSALGQVYATFSSNLNTAPIVCQTVTTNLASNQYTTNRVWQGKNLGIGMSFYGGSASNTGTIGFQFAVVGQGTAYSKTTTHPFVINSTANGATPVIDWGVIPFTSVGPADAIVFMGITNAAVNVNATYTNGSVTVSNLWLEMDTKP